jgi:predicted DNA-binding protein
MPPSELEALRSLSDETGEAVSFHIRQAIRLYLKEVNND